MEGSIYVFRSLISLSIGGYITAQTYYKSLVVQTNELLTTTLDPNTGQRSTCQTIGEIIQSGKLVPSSLHRKLPKRLCASWIGKGYIGGFRRQGLIYTTEGKPSFCSPTDLMALTTDEDPSVYVPKDEDSRFIEGHEKFIFTDIEEMLSKYRTSKDALDAVNALRSSNGLNKLDERRFNYNECCFTEAIRILPVALVGTSADFVRAGRLYHLPVYRSIEEYLQKLENLKVKTIEF